MKPRDATQSILASSSRSGLGLGCSSVIYVARGLVCSAFAAVSFALVVGSRLALVLVVPRSRGFVCPQCWFAFGVGFGLPVWRWFRLSLMLVRVWCWSIAFGLGFGSVR